MKGDVPLNDQVKIRTHLKSEEWVWKLEPSARNCTVAQMSCLRRPRFGESIAVAHKNRMLVMANDRANVCRPQPSHMILAGELLNNFYGIGWQFDNNLTP